MNHIFLVEAILPGYSVYSGYIVFAESDNAAKDKLLNEFPKSDIRDIKQIKESAILNFHGYAFSPLK